MMRRIAQIIALATLLLLAGATDALADRGMIRPRVVGEVNVEEPAQRAIIAHNGMQEILILQTDVKSERDLTIVEFMPLPSKPDVSLAPDTCFQALADLVRKHGLKYYSSVRRPGRPGGTEKAEEAVTVVVTAELGPHNVTVVEVKDSDEFAKWVRTFFKENQLGEPDFGEDLTATVADYLQRDLRFFAFDVVKVSPKQETIQPLTYVFESHGVYYPLKVTNLYGGVGTVELFFVLPEGSGFPGLRPIQRVLQPSPDRQTVPRHRFLFSSSIRLKREDLARLHKDLPAFMGKNTVPEFPRVYLFAVKYEGPLLFQADIHAEMSLGESSSKKVAKPPRRKPTACVQLFVQALNQRDSKLARSFTGVPFAFDGQAVVESEERLEELLPKLFPEKRETPLQMEKLSVDHALRGTALLLKPSDWFFFEESMRKFIHAFPDNVSLRMLRATIADREWVFVLKGKAAGGYRIVAVRREPVAGAGEPRAPANADKPRR